jgi:hypothetical protein
MLQNEGAVNRTAVISYNSQAFIMATNAHTAKPGQYLMDEYLEMTETMGRGQAGTRRGPKFELRWISAHSGVDGNEIADAEAKAAAQGGSSPAHALPPILRNTLPTSATAIKQEFTEMLKKRWEEGWKKSPRYRRVSAYDNAFPFKRFRRETATMTRKQAS